MRFSNTDTGLLVWKGVEVICFISECILDLFRENWLVKYFFFVGELAKVCFIYGWKTC